MNVRLESSALINITIQQQQKANRAPKQFFSPFLQMSSYSFSHQLLSVNALACRIALHLRRTLSVASIMVLTAAGSLWYPYSVIFEESEVER